MNEIILMSDPRIAAVPVRECGEPMSDLRRDGGVFVDRRKETASGACFHLRRGLVERLHRAESMLPDGLRLLVVEGYRPSALQHRYFDEYASTLRAGNPGWDDRRIRAAASRYVSPPEVAPHCAGAAVDLTLADGSGCELDLGTPMNATPEESAGACYTGAVQIGDRARELRGVLGQALSAAGLVNYPTEWWHWSYGDRYWALLTGAPHAVYGPVRHA